MAPRRSSAVVLAVAGPIVAWALLRTVVELESAAIAVHVTAVPPFGVAHDLRWLAMGVGSWSWLALWLPVAVLGRAALDATIAWGLWPGASPAWSILFRRALVATVVATLVLWPWVGLLYAGRALSWSWMVIAGVVPIVLLAPWLATASAVPRWWRRPATWRDLGVAVGATLGLSVVGTAVALGPDWVALVAVAASGLVSVVLWSAVVRIAAAAETAPVAATAGRLGSAAPTRPRSWWPPRSSWRWSSLGVAATVGLLVAGTAVGFDLGAGGLGIHPDDLGELALEQPVVVLGGFETTWDGDPQRWFGSRSSRRFSYAGLDAAGRARPYGPQATEASLAVLVARLDGQVRRLAEDSGRPVALVGESLGALVVRTYLAAQPDAPVDTAVLVSPLLAPGRLPAGTPAGTSVGSPAQSALAVLTPLARALGPFALRVDSPLLRSIDELGPALSRLQTCPAPGRRLHLLLPAAAGLAQPRLDVIAPSHHVVAGFHGNQLVQRPVQRRIAGLLRGEVGEDPGHRRAYTFAYGLAAGWQVPAPTLPAATTGCADARAAVRDGLGAPRRHDPAATAQVPGVRLRP